MDLSSGLGEMAVGSLDRSRCYRVEGVIQMIPRSMHLEIDDAHPFFFMVTYCLIG